MPRAYVETHPNGLAIDRNVQAAIDGFLALAFDITTFTREDIEADKFWRVADKNPFVGSIKTVTQHFAGLGKVPDRIDYPQPLQGYLGRSVQQMPLEEALCSTSPVFIKPVDTKLFDGAVYNGHPDRRSYFADYLPCSVWCSELIPDIRSEWRCYIHENRFVHASCYSGDFLKSPDWSVVEAMVAAWQTRPIACTLDVAVSAEKGTVLVEANDFWSISSYGLDSVIYAEMLRDRYFQIVSW